MRFPNPAQSVEPVEPNYPIIRNQKGEIWRITSLCSFKLRWYSICMVVASAD